MSLVLLEMLVIFFAPEQSFTTRHVDGYTTLSAPTWHVPAEWPVYLLIALGMMYIAGDHT
ncbi:MAG: hypothetical protein HYR67_02540 [Bacteroidetes bacterium]|nr:hypothetical protein [Bacteroidota bacterium]